jgi:hypothetical protein
MLTATGCARRMDIQCAKTNPSTAPPVDYIDRHNRSALLVGLRSGMPAVSRNTQHNDLRRDWQDTDPAATI